MTKETPNSLLEKFETWNGLSDTEKKRRIPMLVSSVITPLLIFVFSSVWKVDSDSGSVVRVRPPSAVFGIAWALIILLIIGTWFAFIMTTESSALLWGGFVAFFLYVLFAIIWLYMYSKKGSIQASWVLWFLVLISLVLWTVAQQTNWIFGITLAPNLVWVLFASILNTIEAQHENDA